MRTSPLRGMPLGMMQSNAEIRSVATKSRRSPKSNISRTLPLFNLRKPGRSNFKSGSFNTSDYEFKVQNLKFKVSEPTGAFLDYEGTGVFFRISSTTARAVWPEKRACGSITSRWAMTATASS